MNPKLKPIALAVLVAATQLAGVAFAQAAKAATAPVERPAQAATKAPVPGKSPEGWTAYDGTTYAPSADAVGQHLDAAGKALKAKDAAKAAAEMRAVADELNLQLTRADAQNRALVAEDKMLLAGDMKFAQDSAKRMNASAEKATAAAAAIESGKIKSKADLDKAIDRAARAEMERRWLASDTTSRYPPSEEPQRHFTDAIAAYARKDFKAAATDIDRATGYLRLEAGRATGEAEQELNSSAAQLDSLSVAVGKGGVEGEQAMDAAFEKADHALALEHRAKAAESWARKDYGKAGHEFQAAAQGLEAAAGWAGEQATAAASATVADTKALGDKLASGAAYTRDEVAKGFESLGKGINALGRTISGAKKALPVKLGA